MKITAQDLKEMGIIDGIISEVSGGAHRNVTAQSLAIKECLIESLKELSLLSAKEIIDDRYDKFRAIGQYTEL
ncbi:hypothetical protein D7X33_45475 [Butyricicoccus sp. 1XD8-22]|nr:hypothetical protein D7X33_45475 [Butyricicoccus sp. 1XD8-22]